MNPPHPTSEHQTSPNTGILYLIVIQVVSRGLTFVGNQVLLRYLSPDHLGLAIQLETLSISVLYTARESLRVVLQREPTETSHLSNPAPRKSSSQQIVNLAYLVLLGGVLLASLFGSWYLNQAPSEVVDSTDFSLAFRLYALATIAELVAEPCFLIIQQHVLFRVRARAETIAAITRCLSACFTALIMSRRNVPLSVLPFAVGQLSYGLSLLLTYLIAARGVSNKEGFSLIPQQVSPASSSEYFFRLFYKRLVTLAGAFYGQSIFKWLLTQGDTLVLSLFADLQAQGIFALASNYGGLVSRLLFQPVEESSRNILGQLLSTPPQQSNGKSDDSNGPFAGVLDHSHPPDESLLLSQQRLDSNTMDLSHSNTKHDPRLATSRRSPVEDKATSAATDTDQAPQSAIIARMEHLGKPDNIALDLTARTPNIDKALAYLTNVLHAYLLLIVVPCVTLLPHLFPLLVRLLLGGGPTSRWSTPETFELLATYSYYIPCLAMNGVLDAFVTSVATEAQLGVQSVLMIIITAIYLGSAWLAMRWLDLGAVGLVGANMLGMVLRIGYSLWFIQGWILANTHNGKSRVRKLVKDSLPNGLIVAIAVAVAFALHGSHIVGSSPDRVSSPSPGKLARQILSGFFDLNAVKGLKSVLPLDKVEYRITSMAQTDVFLELGNVIGAAIFLGVSIIFLEQEFLFNLLEPILPHRFKPYILPYLKSQPKDVVSAK